MLDRRSRSTCAALALAPGTLLLVLTAPNAAAQSQEPDPRAAPAGPQGALNFLHPAPGVPWRQGILDARRRHPGRFGVRGGLTSWAQRAKSRRAAAGGDPSHPDAYASVAGTVRIPVLPIDYASPTAGTPTTAEIADVLFTGSSGTVTDYYDEVSYGNLEMTGDVFDYANVAQGVNYYELDSNGDGIGDRFGELIQEALSLTDPAVDFGLYDNDGPDGLPNSGDDDGMVDLMSFLHPHPGGECSLASTAIWAHSWVYSGWFPGSGGFQTNDPRPGGGFVTIDSYTVQSARSCAGGKLQIGTFCHEAGHVFGLPDLYDTGEAATATPPDSSGLGFWSLMAAGNWNSPSSPAHMSAWEKAEMGWLHPTLLTDPVPAAPTNIAAVAMVPEAYQIVVGNGEYFLIENRQPLGFDANLLGCGLAIYHVDEATISANLQTNTVNNLQNCGIFVQQPQAHYGIALEQADGGCQLEANVSWGGDAGDLFPGSSGQTSFDSSTTPSSDSYAGPTSVAVRNISACGPVMTAEIDALPLPSATSTGVDVVFLIDNTGSYADDYPEIQAQMPDIVAKLSAAFPDIRYGLAIFQDFPYSPFGQATDTAFELRLPLSTQPAFLAAMTDLTTTMPPSGGADLPESQYEALFQTLVGTGRDLDGDTVLGTAPGEIPTSSMGWSPSRHRVIYLLTDASFHDSDTEDYPGTPSKAQGALATKSLIATTFSPDALTLFVMVAGHHDAFLSSGFGGGAPNPPHDTLFVQAKELTALTGGGACYVDSDSSGLTEAVEKSIQVLLNDDIAPGSCAQKPVVVDIDPPFGPMEGGLVTIFGDHFVPEIEVLFDGEPATVVSVDDQRIVVVAPGVDVEGASIGGGGGGGITGGLLIGTDAWGTLPVLVEVSTPCGTALATGGYVYTPFHF